MLLSRGSSSEALVFAISGIDNLEVRKVTIKIIRINTASGISNCCICTFSIEVPLNIISVTKKGAAVVPIELIPVVIFKRCTDVVPFKLYEETYGLTTTCIMAAEVPIKNEPKIKNRKP